MKTYFGSLFAAASVAKTSPWVTNFDEKLAEVYCGNGPKQCGASNLLATGGEECGSGKACRVDAASGWETCNDVAEWQCFRTCPDGQSLSPLRWC